MTVLTTSDGRLSVWRAMVTGRAFDRAMCAHNGHWHEARGEEAVFIGGFAGLEDGDVIAPHFRGACAVALMNGVDPAELAASVFGSEGSRSDGYWRGDICPAPSRRTIGMFSGSLGTTVAYAVGAALHLKLNGGGSAAVCAFGDGTANAGIVAESMNLASMLRLPVVFICQNNQYATSMPALTAFAGGQLTDRARALSIPSLDVNGNDVAALMVARDEGLARARAGEGPTFVHALTYRMGGHYMNDPETYRTTDEVAEWLELDPIDQFLDVLVNHGDLTPEDGASFVADEVERMGSIVSEAKTRVSSDVGAMRRSAFAEHMVGAS